MQAPLVWGPFCQAASEWRIRSIAKPARAGGVKAGRRPNLAAYSVARPHLDSFEHDGTAGAVGMTIGGEPAFGRGSIAPRPCIRWVQDPNHDALMRIGGEAPRRRTHSFSRHESQGGRSGPRHLEPSSAPALEAGWAETVGRFLCNPAHKAGRRTMPSGIAPSRTSRHRAISSLRASATIIVLRV
jgi:hypothetical protein